MPLLPIDGVAGLAARQHVDADGLGARRARGARVEDEGLALLRVAGRREVRSARKTTGKAVAAHPQRDLWNAVTVAAVVGLEAGQLQAQRHRNFESDGFVHVRLGQLGERGVLLGLSGALLHNSRGTGKRGLGAVELARARCGAVHGDGGRRSARGEMPW